MAAVAIESESSGSSGDVCLLANLIHYFSPEENRQLLTRVRAAVEPAAALLLADFWTTQPTPSR